MTISDVISANYPKLQALIKNTDTEIYKGFTGEDVFHNCLMTALSKFKDKEVDEKEALDYLKKLILTESKFSYRRKNKDILIITDSITEPKSTI